MRVRQGRGTQPMPRVTAHDPGYLTPQRSHLPATCLNPVTRPVHNRPTPTPPRVTSAMAYLRTSLFSSIPRIISRCAGTRVEVECISRRRVKRLQCVQHVAEKGGGSCFDVEGMGWGCERCLGGGCKGERGLVVWLTDGSLDLLDHCCWLSCIRST